MADFHIIPTVPDFEGHSIELYSLPEPAVQGWISGEQEFGFHRALLVMERRANEHLTHLTQKYSYHFIFRISPPQYYMTRTVAKNINFLRHNSHGIEERNRAQSICYEAFERQLRLSDVEEMILIKVTNCSARDAMVLCACFPDSPAFLSFLNEANYFLGRWLENNRVAYFAMQACISPLDKLGSENTSHI